eukprot:TRINITY_DN2562_c0_g1::TRINITY_DN2562_c0_g1_i2::g.19410::m.19410 TRINITY_DN2562_c0_g1::TRINITY_DN2562_c0_g1_i2::g.19410  ORF type:complete len:521 (-),score=60.99 TRINITY_DN2562_c0_g1_i2:224-1786(-)
MIVHEGSGTTVVWTATVQYLSNDTTSGWLQLSPDHGIISIAENIPRIVLEAFSEYLRPTAAQTPYTALVTFELHGLQNVSVLVDLTVLASADAGTSTLLCPSTPQYVDRAFTCIATAYDMDGYATGQGGDTFAVILSGPSSSPDRSDDDEQSEYTLPYQLEDMMDGTHEYNGAISTPGYYHLALYLYDSEAEMFYLVQNSIQTVQVSCSESVTWDSGLTCPNESSGPSAFVITVICLGSVCSLLAIIMVPRIKKLLITNPALLQELLFSWMRIGLEVLDISTDTLAFVRILHREEYASFALPYTVIYTFACLVSLCSLIAHFRLYLRKLNLPYIYQIPGYLWRRLLAQSSQSVSHEPEHELCPMPSDTTMSLDLATADVNINNSGDYTSANSIGASCESVEISEKYEKSSKSGEGGGSVLHRIAKNSRMSRLPSGPAPTLQKHVFHTILWSLCLVLVEDIPMIVINTVIFLRYESAGPPDWALLLSSSGSLFILGLKLSSCRKLLQMPEMQFSNRSWWRL